MQARLFCRTGSLEGTDHTIENEVVIGRNPACTLQLQPPVIARKHARIYYDEKQECFMLEDLGSRNGTELDGIPVTKPERLERLHVITFARQFDFVFQIVDTAAAKPAASEGPKPASPEPPPSPAPDADRTIVEKAARPGAGDTRPAGPPPAADATVLESPAVGGESRPDAYVLDFASSGGEKGKLKLKRGDNTIGRAKLAGDASVSREHAKITVGAKQVTVTDLGSRNGTHVDNTPTSGEVVITESSTLKFGSVMAKLVRIPG